MLANTSGFPYLLHCEGANNALGYVLILTVIEIVPPPVSMVVHSSATSGISQPSSVAILVSET